MNGVQRPLAGSVVNLSISESEDSAERGFPAWQVNRVTLQVVAALFGQGVGVVFGHDWREDGVMEAVHGFARQMQSPVPIVPEEAEAIGQPLLRNLLPWPDEPRLPNDDLERLASTLRVERAELPDELKPYEERARNEGLSSPLYRYVRARGLTNLRHRLGALAHVRLCLGGRTSGAAGRYPGVVEEAFLALQVRKPLYLAGLLGGATYQMIEAIEGRDMPKSFCAPTDVNDLYSAPPVAERNPRTRPDRLVDRGAVWEVFRRAGRAALAETNRLSKDENAELFSTPVLDRVIQLVLTGLSRLQANSRR
jgi:hypothetical protein